MRLPWRDPNPPEPRDDEARLLDERDEADRRRQERKDEPVEGVRG